VNFFLFSIGHLLGYITLILVSVKLGVAQNGKGKMGDGARFYGKWLMEEIKISGYAPYFPALKKQPVPLSYP
jgi:hypothetical protein